MPTHLKGVVSLVTLSLLILASPGRAQEEEPPKYEAFAGYSYLRGDFGQGHGDLGGGAILSGAFTLTDRVSLTGEWSTHHDTFHQTNIDNNLFLFGPRIYPVGRERFKRFSPFVHALFGLHHTQAGFPGLKTGDDDVGFAYAAGGGLDIKLTDRLAVRALQADYVIMDVSLPTTFGQANQFTDNIRLSSGVVFRWGKD